MKKKILAIGLMLAFLTAVFSKLTTTYSHRLLSTDSPHI